MEALSFAGDLETAAAITLIAVSAATSFLAAALGLGGGVILLAVMALILPALAADGTCDAVVFLGVEEHLHDADALKDVLHAQRVLGGFSDDRLVAFAIDHDLPLT